MCATSPTLPSTPTSGSTDFEEEEGEVETEADRAIAALEAVRKKKEEHAKWMRWAEMQYPDPSKKANPSAAVSTTGNAVVTAAPGTSATNNLPLPNLKKPASAMKPEEVRAENRRHGPQAITSRPVGEIRPRQGDRQATRKESHITANFIRAKIEC